MYRIKIASASLNQVPLDWAGNSERIVTAINEARDAGASLLCLPELAISGYGCADLFWADWVLDTAWNELKSICAHTQGMVVCVGLPVKVRNRILNVAALCVDAKLVGLVSKRSLATDGVHYEGRWFDEGPSGEIIGYMEGVPVGDLQFNVGSLSIAVEICRDAWTATSPSRLMAGSGVDLVLNPSASHAAFGKREVRRSFGRECSRVCGAVYVYSNLLGCESGSIVFDGDSRIVSEGKIVTEAESFEFTDSSTTVAVVDIDGAACQRMRQPQLSVTETPVVQVDFKIPEVSERTTAPSEVAGECRNDFFVKASALGTFDYLRKTASKGYVVSLSGGADSGAVAIIATLSLRLAWERLGKEGIRKRLPSIVPWDSVNSVDELVELAITAVYQATENSSEATASAASTLAEGLGIKFHSWHIDAVVAQYRELVEQCLGTSFSWDTDDLVLQNIQPRVRVPGVWMIANYKGSLLLSTGNRSEAVVGYCTMDGDTSGGFNPIGGVSKHFLLQWLAWVRQHGVAELGGEFSALDGILKQEPSAELRPLSSKQTDEKDLMPYAVLERMEDYAIYRKMSPREVKTCILEDFASEYKAESLDLWVKKFFTKWGQSQWKRERLSVGLHLDKFSVDARGWCRFPVLNSGFRSELDSIEN